MSDRWRQRRKHYYEWLHRIDRSDGAEKNLYEMLRRVLGSSDENAKIHARFSDQLGGVPILHPKGSGTSEKNEPLVDVFEDQDSVVIVTELIGIDKSNVDLHTTQNRLTISVDSPDCKRFREIELPTRVDVGSSSSRLKNGVLEIRMKKLREELVVR